MNAFGRIAGQLELNAVVHLGDYIYEYASGVYGDTTLGRLHEPRHEVITAEDYYIRYAQYRRDPQLLAAHAVHPFICIWDDHEVANDSYTTGAENHDALTEGSYLTRMTSAKEIYYNWMPIREQANGAIYRSLSFGQTADLHMLDERLAGRDQPATSFSPTELGDTTRRMLGEEQFGWLCSELRYSTARWQLIGNQVLFSELDLSDILPQYAVNLDAWDGYAYEQQRLKDSLAHYENSNTIFLTGDTHCSWYFDVNDQHGERLAHELATPSVSSANYDEFIIGWDTLTVARYRLYRNNDHLHYTNIKDHGYLYLQLDSASAQAEFHYSESIRYPTQKEQAITTFNLTYVDHTPAR
jgi:alkaline phosphatase D